MEIKIIPGPRNEEKIIAIQEIHDNCSPDEWAGFVSNCAGDNDLLDALYYASEFGKNGLEDQEDYFYELLLHDEKEYFAARLGGVEL